MSNRPRPGSSDWRPRAAPSRVCHFRRAAPAPTVWEVRSRPGSPAPYGYEVACTPRRPADRAYPRDLRTPPGRGDPPGTTEIGRIAKGRRSSCPPPVARSLQPRRVSFRLYPPRFIEEWRRSPQLPRHPPGRMDERRTLLRANAAALVRFGGPSPSTALIKTSVRRPARERRQSPIPPGGPLAFATTPASLRMILSDWEAAMIDEVPNLKD